MKALVSLVALVWVVSARAEVAVEAGSAMRYLANSSDPGLSLTWTAEAFDDSSWAAGSYGVGYDNDGDALDILDTLVENDTRSTFTRATFEVVDVGAVTRVVIGADYDDGWAAWINGVEVFRSREMDAGPLDWDEQPDSHESSNGPVPVYAPHADVTALALPVLHDGTNVLAVAAYNRGPISSDLVLVPQLLIDPASVLQRGPYLQLATPSSMVLRWRTLGEKDSLVEIGPSPENLSVSGGDPTPMTDHEIELTGLTPDTQYYYAIGTSTDRLAGGDADHHFRTPPLPGTTRPTRVWVLGDSGTADASAQNVRDAYIDHAAGTATDVWLMLGDNAYEDGTDAEYQDAVFRTYPSFLRTVALWSTLGNHDGVSADSGTQSGVYYDTFTLPTVGEAGGTPSGTEAYYSFDHANVHFICLDSFDTDTDPDGTMMTWLDLDIQDTAQTWVIAFWHHPPYSKGNHDSDEEALLIDMRERALPILEDVGVDLVLAGHSHSYERSFLIDGHYEESGTFGPEHQLDAGDGRVAGDGEYRKPTAGTAPHEGTVYVVAGSSGRISAGDLDHAAMIVSLEELASVVIDVEGDRLDVTMLDEVGQERDSFTVIKGCVSEPCAEAECANGLDDDDDGDSDCEDSDCAEDPACWESGSCNDGIDNDGDGLTDCADPDCAADSACGLGVALRMNSGGPDFTDSGGDLFEADAAFVSGGFGFVGGRTAYFGDPVAGTTDDPLYQDIRGGPSFSYVADVPNGDYEVTLHFNEPFSSGAGQRQFDVTVEGLVELDDFDVFAAAGGQDTAHVETFPTTVLDGQLDIEFAPVVGNNAIVTAVEISSGGPPPESDCTNAVDDDADGLTDCADSDCVADPSCLESGNCTDGVDNDGDGLTDCADADCAGDPGCVESDCTNGADDDGDGLTDCADVDCAADPSCLESGNCTDGVDNDGDGLTDCADADCAGDPGCVESDCTNGADDDGDGLTDCADVDCAADPSCLESGNCTDGVDNDGDGLTDCADADCAGDPGCVESDCTNGADDDGDGLTDCADADCAGDPGCIESDCTNGADDDGDGLTDCADVDCAADPSCLEPGNCTDGVDNDGDGLTDCADVDCAAAPSCLEPGNCTDGVDNDGDGLTDCADPDCVAEPACGSAVALRMNSGGPDFTDSGGDLFEADAAFVPGGFGFAGGETASFGDPVAGTTDDPLYQDLRGGPSFSYVADVPDGDFEVTLHFNEPFSSGAGQRQFDVTVEGLVELDDFDVFAAAGGQDTAHVEAFLVTVSDGQLNINFTPVVARNAILSAVEIVAMP